MGKPPYHNFSETLDRKSSAPKHTRREIFRPNTDCRFCLVANTTTSGAIRLDPASDAEARLAQDDWAEKRYPESDGGQAKGLAVENTQGSYQTGGASSNSGMAPSYATSQYVDAGGPKGRNLTEGGFESNDSKNASFNSEVGTKRDPGRAAELKFQTENADTAGNAAIPAQGAAGDAPYDILQPETSA
jgi:hypothetical protein